MRSLTHAFPSVSKNGFRAMSAPYFIRASELPGKNLSNDWQVVEKLFLHLATVTLSYVILSLSKNEV